MKGDCSTPSQVAPDFPLHRGQGTKAPPTNCRMADKGESTCPGAVQLCVQLDSARWVRYDIKSGMLLVWYGGDSIHAYDTTGRELHMILLRTAGLLEPDLVEAKRCIEERVARQDWLDFDLYYASSLQEITDRLPARR